MSCFHRAMWSRERFDGLRKAFADAGYPNAVTLSALEDIEKDDDILAAALRRCDLPKLLSAYRNWGRDAPASFYHLFDKHLSSGTSMLDNAAVWGELRVRMDPLFHQASEDKSCTAWVCCNDFTASIALDFLSTNNHAVPADLSLISFDDSPTAFAEQITSYNFNTAAAANRLLYHVVHYDRRMRRNYLRSSEVDGYVVERGSVADRS